MGEHSLLIRGGEGPGSLLYIEGLPTQTEKNPLKLQILFFFNFQNLVLPENPLKFPIKCGKFSPIYVLGNTVSCDK
jgi:hypothetical protein